MKICILIGCHKDFDFVNRIISKLRHKDVDIWLNIDKKAPLKENDFEDCFIVKKRFDIKWGDISQIDATINALKEITNSKVKYDRIIYISGQDYPIKPIEEIIVFFNKKENRKKEFVGCADASKNGWDISYRWEKYNCNHIFLKIVTRLLPKKKFIPGYKPYAGATWFNLTHNAAAYIVEKYENDKFHEHFKTSICIDEVVIPTILMHDDSKFKKNIVQDIKRYIDWSDHGSGLNKGNPNILKLEDYDKIIASDALFARKFDPKVDSEILDKLDEYMEKYYEKNISSNR